MIRKFIEWYFSPTEKLIIEEHNFYSKIVELEERIAKLEEENIETSNTLYEIMNAIDAVDVRIDILTGEKWINKDV